MWGLGVAAGISYLRTNFVFDFNNTTPHWGIHFPTTSVHRRIEEASYLRSTEYSVKPSTFPASLPKLICNKTTQHILPSTYVVATIIT